MVERNEPIPSESGQVEDDSQPICANCGGEIGETDVTCPHCGISLVAG